MNKTTINIRTKNKSKIFKYIIESAITSEKSSDNKYYESIGDLWNACESPDNQSNMINIKLYCPVFSVGVYEKNLFYILKITGENTVSVLLDTSDLLACDSNIIKGENRYYEYFNINVPMKYNGIIEYSLYPVSPSLINKAKYINISTYDYGWSFLEQYDNNISTNIMLSYKDNAFIFNTLMEKSNDCQYQYELVVKDKDNIYKYLTCDVSGELNNFMFDKNTTYTIQQSFEELYNKTHEQNDYLNKILFSGWGDYIEGMVVIGSLNIMTNDGMTYSYMSNEIPLTPLLFKQLLIEDKYKIDLSNVNIYNIDIINKIENKEIVKSKVETPVYNNIMPIFYSLYDINDIIIHNNVVEYIAINNTGLPSSGIYKLQIGDNIIKEDCKIDNKILFKINNLNCINDSYEYCYILNDNGLVVTTGKYKTE